MASNEEMQSTNEELQSVNEELTTANLERTKKIEEVIQTKTDIDNLIRGAEICTIILNNKLEIRIFTAPIEKIFNLVSHDIGRPLKNFKHNLQDDHFMTHVEDVLVHNIAYQAEVKNGAL
jgi:two-component system CheB/CheR fusion protein